MTEQAKKYLSDIQQAIELIETFTEGINSFFDYQKDLKTKSDSIDDSIVWTILKNHLPILKSKVDSGLQL